MLQMGKVGLKIGFQKEKNNWRQLENIPTLAPK